MKLVDSSFTPIPERAIERIGLASERLRRTLPAGLEAEYLGRYIGALPRWDEISSADDVHRKLKSLDQEISTRFGAGVLPQFSRLLVASLALTLSGRLAERRISQSILEIYPLASERLATELTEAATPDYFGANEFFLKDLRFAAGLSVSAGPMIVELRSIITVGSLVKCIVRFKTVGNAARMLAGQQWKPWFRRHIDPRYKEEMNATGFDRAYRRVADMLEMHPDVRGIVATCWLNDPALGTVSPRLAYMANPLKHGAFVLRHGPGEVPTTRATQTSPTRRKLVEEGKYTPVCYSLVWPREKLIPWARQGQ